MSARRATGPQWVYGFCRTCRKSVLVTRVRGLEGRHCRDCLIAMKKLSPEAAPAR